jgi:hypothetical protein
VSAVTIFFGIAKTFMSQAQTFAEVCAMSSDEEDSLSSAPSCNHLPIHVDMQSFREPDIEMIENNWLQIPDEFINPKKMCAVNQFVHIVQELDDSYYSTSCELVLLGTGNSMPDHFRYMIYCVEMINQLPSIKGSFVPVVNKTRSIKVPLGRQTAKSKNYDIIGVEKLISRRRLQNETKRSNFVKTRVPVNTFLADCAEMASNTENPVYARVNFVNLNWGLIPVQYEEGGVIKRRIFQVLRVIPQPGLHLLDLIRKRFFERRNDHRSKESVVINEVCHYLQLVINFEADINYGMLGVWDNTLPNPWSVTDPMNPTSVQRLLSPFTVLIRLLHHIKAGFSGEIQTHETTFNQSGFVVDGFPCLNSHDAVSNALEIYSRQQEIYLGALRTFEYEFSTELAKCSADPDKDGELTPILYSGSRSHNMLKTGLNMVFMLQNYMKFAKEKVFAESDRLIIPKLGIAMIDLFIFFQTSDVFMNMDEIQFITAHVGEHLARELVTETRIATKYRVTDVQSLEDFPKAGQHKEARDGYKRNATKLIAETDNGTGEVQPQVVEFYQSYLRLQFTATMNGLAMDSWMSDRVFRSAAIMDQLIEDLCPCKMMREALMWVVQDTTPEVSQKILHYLVHDQSAYMWARMNLALCRLNLSVKANPLNLSIVWGMLKGDILTFMGLHNQTWRWIMYCLQVAPCFGHLKAQTDDGHAARGECILTAKPNSVGLNDVIVKTVNFCLEGLLSNVVSLTEEDKRVLRLDKVDRRTRAGLEASQSVELANDRVISKPTSSKLMMAVAVDEALRSFDENALAALINTGLPRDSNAGEGATTKSLKPERGYSEKGEVRQLPGMGWYVLVFATNTNARNLTIAEILRTLTCGAMITYAPGAPQSVGLASAMTLRDKRKRGQATRSSMSMGESMMPSDPKEAKFQAYIFSVNNIIARHIALVNKTAQSDWEISYPLHQYLDSVKMYFFEHFSSFVSNNFAQSCDRQFKGFISRAVAACLMTTVSAQLSVNECIKEAQFQVLKSMEASALTLYWANMALLNGFTHLVDSSLCIVNQLIRWKNNVPVLSINFLTAVLDPDKEIDEQSDDYHTLRRFLERLRDAKLREDDTGADPIKHFTGSYMQVRTFSSFYLNCSNSVLF